MLKNRVFSFIKTFNFIIYDRRNPVRIIFIKFKRKFNETFNNSPKKYITQKKVERAAALLKSRDLRVSDIAYDVGFDSLATFNRNFSNRYGKSPSEYRLS